MEQVKQLKLIKKLTGLDNEECVEIIGKATKAFIDGTGRFGSEEEFLDFVVFFAKAYVCEGLNGSVDKIELKDCRFYKDREAICFWFKETTKDNKTYFTSLNFSFLDE